MKIEILKIILLLNLLTFGQENSKKSKFEIIAEKIGDLDKDGIDEKVIVYETNEPTEYGNVREICILKKVGEKWKDWRNSKSAILKSGEGGMMGDPFQGIEIKNGILSISFYGGSSWKWSYTDKYRFQNNNFELISYLSNYFQMCQCFNSVDFNLSTGKLISKKEYEKCENEEQKIYKRENETFYKKNIELTLKNRREREIKILTPKYNREIYITN